MPEFGVHTLSSCWIELNAVETSSGTDTLTWQGGGSESCSDDSTRDDGILPVGERVSEPHRQHRRRWLLGDKVARGRLRAPRLIERFVAVESLESALRMQKATPGDIAIAAAAYGVGKAMRLYLEALRIDG